MKKQTISAALSVAALLAAGIALAVPVKVSSFGYNPTDATECLQKALDSGERQLVVDRQDGGWNVRPLKLTKGNVEIVLEPGVVIRAKKGEFVDGYDTLLSVEGATNVVIRGGEGSGIAMNKADYADRSRYAFSTHRHALGVGHHAAELKKLGRALGIETRKRPSLARPRSALAHRRNSRPPHVPRRIARLAVS